MKQKHRILTRVIVPAIIAALFTGCAAIGPPTIDRDRLDYVSAISESWKRQTLLNLVKTRYLDAPVFMDVGSVINQYALESEVEMGFDWASVNSQSLSGNATYTDRPTISYTPLMGADFARSLLHPISIGSILLLIQSGYPIDQVLQICAQSINGLDNRSVGNSRMKADPEFYELLGLLRKIQVKDGMRMRSRLIDGKETIMIFFREPETDADAAILKRILQLLGLNPDSREFRIIFGNLAENDLEIAILSRSMIQIMSEYASYINVPDSDISEGRVTGNHMIVDTDANFPPLIRVNSGKSKPDDAFVAVPYRDHWFWIDDRDIRSKRIFYFLMIMFSFSEKGESAQAAPMLTIPTN